MTFTEDSRVKIPALLHLTRLGYRYLPLKGASWDQRTNIFTDIFKDSIERINPDAENLDVNRLLEEITLVLDSEDLGKEFYKKLTDRSGIKLIDFANFHNNQFHVVTELTYKNGDEEFRPDITLLINGMPLAFIEVKKPNNKDGVLAERERINTRCKNRKFWRFVNITQLMVFSNNMEYDNDSLQPIEGAFYATPAYDAPVFNYFREDSEVDPVDLGTLPPPGDDIENTILKDTNHTPIKHNPEFQTNKSPDTPTNRILTSLFSKNRLAFILEYAIAYVQKTDSSQQKQIMRYPQLFATKAIVRKLDEGIRKGIIWHTQGSGKTALAYYNVHYLTDYFRKRSITPKFYFIVDRLDLLNQAQQEFSARGLAVHTIGSRDDFSRDIKSTSVIHNLSGKTEITVVNIQRFKDDPDVVRTEDYDVNIQRVYFLDEVHRSYNPRGSFLANLNQSDQNAIKIGLTGTPLLGSDHNSRALFGNYIHKYYYNASIADGYTLRLIREEIETTYKISLQKALQEIEIKQGDIGRKLLYAHPRFVEPMLDYIVENFEQSRITLADNTIGGMVICDSAEQAKKMFEIFQDKYVSTESKTHRDKDFEPFVPDVTYLKTPHQKKDSKVTTAALILHDVDTKETRKDRIEKFKAGEIDFLFVYNMLLTGFDASRLKKIYFGRIIKRHNLLQALTRVNRTHKEFRYGYVVDFADISKEFDATNKAYFDELQTEYGDEMKNYSNLFKPEQEITHEIEQVKDALLHFDIKNAEIFSQQINQIQDRDKIQALKKALDDAKSLYNQIRMQGDYDLLDKIDFKNLNLLHREVSNHLDLLNLKEKLEKAPDNINLLNIALEEVLFKFAKVNEGELVLADKLKSALRQTREALAGNFDQNDPVFINLKEELERLFKKKNLSEVTGEEMNANIIALNKIHERIKELNRENSLLRTKYENDTKYTRIHKRLMERGMAATDAQERKIIGALSNIKIQADERVLQNTQMLNNESYFESTMMPLVIQQFGEHDIKLNSAISRDINHLVVLEYMNEYNQEARA